MPGKTNGSVNKNYYTVFNFSLLNLFHFFTQDSNFDNTLYVYSYVYYNNKKHTSASVRQCLSLLCNDKNQICACTDAPYFFSTVLFYSSRE